MGAVGLTSAGAVQRSVPPPRLPRAAAEPRHLDPLPALAFAALALLAAMRFASLLAGPPTVRVLGVVIAASFCGAVLAASARLRAPVALTRAARATIVLAGAYVALRATGAPAHLLWPWRWGDLAAHISRGLDALEGLWPYRGHSTQARLTLLLALPTVLVPAAALVFWPAGRHAAIRRTAGAGLLISLYATAAANESRVGWRVQGVLLLALLCLWACAWRRPAHADVGRAAGWLLVLGVAALAIAGLLPTSRPLIAYDAWNPFGVAPHPTRFEWNQTYGPLRWSRSHETMVEVSSPVPRLWRATTLDHFDGVRFLRSSTPLTDPASGPNAAVRADWLTHTTVTVRGFSAPQLLAPGAALAVSLRGPSIPRLEAIAADGSLASAGAPAATGDSYTVDAYLPQPSVRELRRAPRTVPAAYRPFTEFDLPAATGPAIGVTTADAAGIAAVEASPYAQVYALARRLAAGAAGPYAKLTRVEAFLAHGFSYSERPRSHAYPLAAFLLEERIGYCQQFSGAMALLLRMDGIPARVGAGFLPGRRNPASGRLLVSASDAHAWVEAYFDGIGWVTFDPTPPKPSASPLDAAVTAGFARAGSTGRANGDSSPGKLSPLAGLVPSASHSRAGGAGTTIALALLGALLAALAGAWWWLRARTRRAGPALPVERAGGGPVLELTAALTALGLAPGPGTTLTELERRLTRSHGAAAGAYVALLRAARYGPTEPARTPSGTERRALRQALAAHHGPLTRLRLLVALPPRRQR